MVLLTDMAEFEVVLASGELVTANEVENPDRTYRAFVLSVRCSDRL